MLRPLIVFGTRPEAIKLCPVVLECHRQFLKPIVCSTGQHKDMLASVLAYFGITPDIDLELMRYGQSLCDFTSMCVDAVGQQIQTLSPDCVVVQGDTATSLSAAMAGFFTNTPVIHVEAGLRTNDLQSPFPEEFNRRVITLAASLHCAPTEQAARALRDEGVPDANIQVTGNTGIDSLLATIAKERGRCDSLRKKYPAASSPLIVLITGHRRENFGSGLAHVCDALISLAKHHWDTEFIYPVHLNPNVRGYVHERLDGYSNIHLLPPVDYPEFVWLMDRAKVVLTDSGGVQEEAPSLGCRVLVTRDKTERSEAIDAGAAELVGTDSAAIVRRVTACLMDAPSKPISNPYGDGKASRRIVDWMLHRYG